MDPTIENRLWRDIMLFKLREMKWRIIMGAVLYTLRNKVETWVSCHRITKGGDPRYVIYLVQKQFQVEDKAMTYTEEFVVDTSRSATAFHRLGMCLSTA
jgi:hypothetical protein